MLGLLAAHRLCLAAVTGGYSLVAVRVRASPCSGFFFAVVEHVVGSGCTGFNSCSSRAKLTAACGIFPDQGLNPCPLN